MVDDFSISWKCRTGEHGWLLWCSRWNRTMSISGSVCTAFCTLWLAPITRPYVWKNISMTTWESHETQQKWKAKPVSECMFGIRDASPPCCGGLGSWEFTSKKGGCWIWLCTQNRNPESAIERAQNHLDILKRSYRNKCIFSFHELKYESLLQSLPGNNPNLLSLLPWACTEAAEYFRSCCLAPRNIAFS